MMEIFDNKIGLFTGLFDNILWQFCNKIRSI